MAKNYEDVKTGTNNYFVKYDRGFTNAYGLCYAPAGTPAPEGWERITRKETIKLCVEERERRRIPLNGSQSSSRHTRFLQVPAGLRRCGTGAGIFKRNARYRYDRVGKITGWTGL